MSKFLKWHPSSDLGKKFYESSSKIEELLYKNPKKGFEILEKEWKFGQASELWDDFVFNTLVRKVLDKNQSLCDTNYIDRYSELDHLLFLTYIRREEDPVRFRRAFWNVNTYGQLLASHYISNHTARTDTFLPKIDSSGNKLKIAFVLKGPYKLAHVEFLHNFLDGASIFSRDVEIHLILIDAPVEDVAKLPHISTFSLSKYKSTATKLSKYIDYCQEQRFDHICWVACVQNLSLYMGMQLAKTQSYWSMKYHSIIMPTIQKYAGLGFGGNSFTFDDISWFRGRAFPELSMPGRNESRTNKLLASKKIPQDAIKVGCFVRSEKLYDPIFLESISKIIQSSHNVHFLLASQYLPSELEASIVSKLDKFSQARFHHLGWVNTKKWAYCLDLYFDSSPRGSCNTIFEAIEAGVPVLMADSAHNRESSALPYLSAASYSVDQSKIVPGVYTSEEKRLNVCVNLINNAADRKSLASLQFSLLQSLKGRKYLFAKDYLNYFLDLNLQLNQSA